MTLYILAVKWRNKEALTQLAQVELRSCQFQNTLSNTRKQQQQKRDPNSSSNKTERPTQGTQYAMHAQIICSALFLKSTHGVINMNCLVLNPICNTIDAVPLLYSPFENTSMCC